MFVDTSKLHRNGKTDVRHLLRSCCAKTARSGIEPTPTSAIVRRRKSPPSATGKLDLTLHQGSSVGAVWLLHELARDIGIVDAPGTHRDARLALRQIIARAASTRARGCPRSVSPVRTHAACEVLGCDPVRRGRPVPQPGLAGRCRQDRIEETRRGRRQTGQEAGLFVYDVTSNCLEDAATTSFPPSVTTATASAAGNRS